MSVIRTSLSLVSFGFTISQIFQKLTESKVLNGDGTAGRHFGVALVMVGITMLVLGIVYHGQFMLALRISRKATDRRRSHSWEKPFPAFAYVHNRGDPSWNKHRRNHQHGFSHRPVLVNLHRVSGGRAQLAGLFSCCLLRLACVEPVRWSSRICRSWPLR